MSRRAGASPAPQAPYRIARRTEPAAARAPCSHGATRGCTAGGDDTIYGDGDDAYTAGTEDWMDGGTGTDLCDGDYGWDGSDVSDVSRNCEVSYDAYPDLPGLDLIHCEDSDDPIHEW